MRVLQIIPSVSLVYGGPSQMVLGYSKALADEGIEVTILTTHSNGDTGQPPLDVPLNVPIEQDGYTIRYFRCAPFRRYKFSAGLLMWLASHAHHYDVAHIHALFSPVCSMAATLARWKGLPYVLRPLGTLDPADLKKKRQLKRIYAAVLERANLMGAAAMHFTSAQEAAISERFGSATRDIVLPLGVDVPRLPSSTESRGFCQSLLQAPSAEPSDRLTTLLFMSRIDPKKGLDLLIPALLQLRQEGILFRFVLAGSNPQDPSYEQAIGDRIRSSPLANCTQITGFVTGDAKANHLQCADVFVLPSYYENFGIAVAEAMAASIPVVISDHVHICRDVRKGNAGWVCSCNIQDLTQSLREALTQEAERQHRGQNARQWAADHYSWRAIARQFIKVYQEIALQ
ncbi:MAG: hormogonium polysaccharide biosynthesis glycosyltransferase HpsP [Cyanobacteria bacterium J06627_8]